MYLLDTNHCSRIIFGETNLIQQLELHSEACVATSVIVRGELLYMAAKSQQTAANIQQVKAFLNKIDLYPINLSISDIYGDLKGKLINTFGPKEKAERRKFNIQTLGFGDNDLWIAATAIHYNLTIVSTDNDFRRIQQVYPFALESWV
ncbi:type II toxin-antitoxin system VapC family toxin [Dolichospermum circinale CS-534/05]|uniref:type II toxin-antitoxin system VapC family toxin n=1 Tax=Dolichospermum circinale TaxID=109265 RepID=UPI00232E6F47|nr:type II toxin-antitoxin system VapC family toxin [Dolichospermum circinale]MDB9455416.1 type II toxin-antitoxin system VapC family toxin [Dolichospermum circinale CS-541/06]MDB9464087.1 type II toxin-antitoxin system VapC family toxin [Dolichospermum circinale CS-541/04]MDB9492778.1 type II toxin-antitoxin system VapC family toxin [Dolichospermum circinale CS-534/05]MDB9548377.1 type II toxin-antitoxin system VapC family toxin [Dolichospermum circinale CS-1031]